MAPNAAKTIFCFVFFVENFVLLIKTHLETIIPALLVGQRTCEQYCCAVLAGFSLVNNGVNSAVRPTDRPAWPASSDPFQCHRPASAAAAARRTGHHRDGERAGRPAGTFRQPTGLTQ